MQSDTTFSSILQQIDSIDPVQYGRTRNFVDGAVTRLSPYISRGVISTKQVLDSVLSKGYARRDIEPFVKELCWRDYFQRVAQEKDLNQDIRHEQVNVSNHGIPEAVLGSNTGIHALDDSIRTLYETGYIHNHCRMYIAALVCNIARSHWYNPAQWMYYHLLDGDWASNACSWQWVAGCNSTKKYYANQENINTYTRSHQSDTFLDTTYEELAVLPPPAVLQPIGFFRETVELPASGMLNVDTGAPTFIYNYYNLDPLWHAQENGNRILLLEPDFFSSYPVSRKCIDFMLALGSNIPGLQVYVGSYASLVTTYALKDIHYKEHPLNIGYFGKEETREWISSEIKGYHPSFFSYWKKMEKILF